MFYAMTRWSDWSNYTSISQTWAQPGTDWMTLTFDMAAAQASNPAFNPSIIVEMGVLVQNGSSTPVPTTFWVTASSIPSRRDSIRPHELPIP